MPRDPAKERAIAARKVYEAWAAEFSAGRETALGVYLWSCRLLEADGDLSHAAADRLAAAEAHLASMKAVEKFIMPTVAARRRGVGSYLGAHFYRADAEARLFEAGAGSAVEGKIDAATRRLAAALLIYDTWWSKLDQREQASAFFSGLFWSGRLLQAENALRPNPSDRLAAAEANLIRAMELEKLAKDLVKDQHLRMHFAHAATFYRLDAEMLVSETKPGPKNGASGSADMARARLEAAKAAYEAWWKLDARSGEFDHLYAYSLWWRTAALTHATTKAQRVAASEAHLCRMSELEKKLEELQRAQRVSDRYVFAAQYYRAEAEVMVSQAKAH